MAEMNLHAPPASHKKAREQYHTTVGSTSKLGSDTNLCCHPERGRGIIVQA